MLLKENYCITEIVGHDDISPDRKRDPGPAFPLDKLKDKILYGRNDESPGMDFEEGESQPQKGITTADHLNIRTKPSGQSSTVTEPLPKGTKVEITETQGNWSKVKVEIEGWVSKKWVKTF